MLPASPNIAQQVAKQFVWEPSFDQESTNSDRFGHALTKIDQLSPNLGPSWKHPPWPMLTKCGPMLARMWSYLAYIGQMLATVGQHVSRVGQLGPCFVNFGLRPKGPNMARNGQNCSATCWTMLVQPSGSIGARRHLEAWLSGPHCEQLVSLCPHRSLQGRRLFLLWCKAGFGAQRRSGDPMWHCRTQPCCVVASPHWSQQPRSHRLWCSWRRRLTRSGCRRTSTRTSPWGSALR